MSKKNPMTGSQPVALPVSGEEMAVRPNIGSVSRESAVVSIASTQERSSTPVGYSTYTRMYKSHPIVRACVDKIAKTAVASGYQFVPRDSQEDLNEANAQRLSDLFSRSRFISLLRQTYIDLLIYGDAYWYLRPSRLGQPFQMIRVAPQQVSIVYEKDTREVASYVVRDINGSETQWEPNEIIHFKLFDPDNDLYGLSPLDSLQQTVSQDLFAQSFNLAFFENSAQTGVVFNMKGASREEVSRNRDFLRKEYTGYQNAHKPLVLEGDVSVQRSVATPTEMQFIEGRKQLTQEILAVYDMPYTKLGGSMESANRSQSAENDKSFRSETISPLQSVVEEVVNEHLVLFILGIEDTIFQHKDVDSRDEDQQMKLHIDGLNHGVYSIDYVRSKIGLKPVEGGGEPYISTPLGLMPVSKISNAADAILASKTARQAPLPPMPVDDEDDDPNDEETDVNPDDTSRSEIERETVSAPSYVRANARRGLKLYEEGYGGDGLVPATIADARKMASGTISVQKLRKMSGWISRHMVDFNAPKNTNPDHPDYPGPGLVAHLLWGSGPNRRGAERTLAWVRSQLDRIDSKSG